MTRRSGGARHAISPLESYEETFFLIVRSYYSPAFPEGDAAKLAACYLSMSFVLNGELIEQSPQSPTPVEGPGVGRSPGAFPTNVFPIDAQGLPPAPLEE